MSSQGSASTDAPRRPRTGGRGGRRHRLEPPARLDWLGGGGLVRPPPPPPPPQQQPAAAALGCVDLTADDDERDGVGGWSCRRCTLINPGTLSNCEVCGARRESTRGSAQNGGDGGVKRPNDGGIDERKTAKGTKPSASGKPEGKKKANGIRPLREHVGFSVAGRKKPKRRKPPDDDAKGKSKGKGPRKPTENPYSADMWTDSHRPLMPGELCVAPKKVDAARSFLLADNGDGGGGGRKSSLLILAGGPGTGKSTMVRALAAELNLDVMTWNDTPDEYRPTDDYSSVLPYVGQLRSFEEFLAGSAPGLSRLGGLEDDFGGSGRSTGAGARRGSVILVEELPNLHNAEAREAFRSVMERHVLSTRTPTVLVASDAAEGKHGPDDLERLVPASVLNSDLVTVVTVQPPTKARMRSCLTKIAKKEGIEADVPREYYEEVHLAGGGDMRHAVLDMQFRYGAGRRKVGGKRKRKGGGGQQGDEDGDGASSSGKDARLSMFHALGKLLYAKRGPREEDDAGRSRFGSDPAISEAVRRAWDDGRPPLLFDPDRVLSTIEMGPDAGTSFVSYHCPDFHTDPTDLDGTIGTLSDAAVFLDRSMRAGGSGSDGPYPTDYAVALGGRAVAVFNRNPAPPRFRKLTAPESYGVMRKERENARRLVGIRGRLLASSSGDGGGAPRPSVGGLAEFVTDVLPHARIVRPGDADRALSGLHSYAREVGGGGKGAEDDDGGMGLLASENVLMEDDLVDGDW